MLNTFRISKLEIGTLECSMFCNFCVKIDGRFRVGMLVYFFIVVYYHLSYIYTISFKILLIFCDNILNFSIL